MPDLFNTNPSNYGHSNFAGLVSYTPVYHTSESDVYIDWEMGNRHVLTLTSDCNVYFANPADGTYHLLVIQTGDYVVTWKVNDTDLPTMAWPDGTPVEITTGGSEDVPMYDTLSFSYWHGLDIYMAMATQGLQVPTL
jgi:hypothetical protein